MNAQKKKCYSVIPVALKKVNSGIGQIQIRNEIEIRNRPRTGRFNPKSAASTLLKNLVHFPCVEANIKQVAWHKNST